VVEALQLPPAARNTVAPSPLQAIARFAPGAEPSLPEPAPIPDDAPLTVSHSKIDDYLTCPLKYRYAHVAQIPLQTDPVFMFGRAVHHAIKIYHQHRMKGLPIEIEDVIRSFESSWSSEGFYSREHEERRLEEGRAMLRRFVESDLRSKRSPLAIEMGFSFGIGLNTVEGRFDRIDERPEGVVLVDYKTSEVVEPERADKRAEQSLREEQLGIYALAYHETRKVLPARAELHFVSSGVVGSATVKPEHLENARRRIEQAALGIRSNQFPPRPSVAHCAYCPYSRFCIHSAARGAGG